MRPAYIRTTPIGFQLLVLALTASLPVIFFAAFIVVQMAADRRGRELEELALRASAMTAAVEQALYGASRELAALAVDKDLRDGHLGDAYAEASSFVAQSALASSISLVAPDGRILFNTQHKLGEILPVTGDLEGTLEVMRTGRMHISNLFSGHIDGRTIFTIAMPVFSGTQVAYVLHMVVEPRRILQVIQAQDLNEQWITAVFDRDAITIARSHNPETSVGTPASPGLQQAIAEKREGTFENVVRDGTPVVGTFRYVSLSGWVVAMAVPRSVLDGQSNRFLALLVGGGLAILALAGWMTIRLARRLTRRLVEVGAMAEQLGQGKLISAPASGIRELDLVAQSLSGAAILIASREQDLLLASKTAEDALASKAKFFAAANHDLRQPVQSLFLFHAALQGMLETGHPAAAMLGHMERSLRALEQLLSGLLDVSRLDANAFVVSVARLDLGSLLAALGEEYRLRAAETGITLRSVATSVHVYSDAVLLERIVRNLLENAIRYTRPGGRILLGCRRVGHGVRLEVVDTGIGIPPDQQEAIFEEFHQVGNASRDAAQGLGLGLAIVRRAAQLLGHSVRVASVLGRGSRFSVLLPLAPDQD